MNDSEVRSRQVVGTYPSYPLAQAAVDQLADKRFPVERLSIIAEDLRYVERVTGRRGYARAAFDGGLTGAGTGALVGFVLGLFSLVEPLVSGLYLALYGLLIGGVVGVAIGLLTHAASFRKRDFSSVAGIDAATYAVVADDDGIAREASRMLRETSARQGRDAVEARSTR